MRKRGARKNVQNGEPLTGRKNKSHKKSVRVRIGLLLVLVLCALSFGGCGGSGVTDGGLDEIDGVANVETYGAGAGVKDSEEVEINAKTLPSLATEYSVYDIYDSAVVFNGLGQLIKSDDITYTAVSDILTGETLYYVAEKREYTKTGEYDYDTKVQSRLYDADGELLRDWEETVYGEALGQWIVSHEYFGMEMETEDGGPEGVLLNLETGEELSDVLYLEVLGNSHVAASGYQGGITGVLDKNGNVTAGFPLKLEQGLEPYACGNYIITSEGDEGDYNNYIYNAEGKFLGSISHVEDSYMYDGGIIGDYVNCDGGIYEPSKGDGGELTPIFKEEWVNYFDGEVALATDADDEAIYLYDAESGEKLSGPYETLERDFFSWENETAETKAEAFYAVEDGELLKISREGEVLATSEVGDVTYMTTYANGVVCGDEEWTKACLLDGDLNVVIPYGTYSDIFSVCDESENVLFAGSKNIHEYTSLYDLMDREGNVLLTGVSQFSSAKNGLIGILRGQSVGLIDYKGEWVVKMAKYDLYNGD